MSTSSCEPTVKAAEVMRDSERGEVARAHKVAEDCARCNP